MNGPMLEANYNPVMSANRSALQANEISVASPDDVVKPWIVNRRAFLENQLNIPFEISNNGGASYSTTSASVVLTGRAPVEAWTIQVTGATVNGPTVWSMVPGTPPNRPFVWSIPLTLVAGQNWITVQGIDRNGNPLNNPPGNYTDSIVITRQ